MTNYETFHGIIQDKVNEGELTIEAAEAVNDAVFEMVSEAGDGCISDYDKFYDSLTERVEDGTFTLEAAEVLNDFMAEEIYSESEDVDDDDVEEAELLSEAVEYLENLCEDYNID